MERGTLNEDKLVSQVVPSWSAIQRIHKSYGLDWSLPCCDPGNAHEVAAIYLG